MKKWSLEPKFKKKKKRNSRKTKMKVIYPIFHYSFLWKYLNYWFVYNVLMKTMLKGWFSMYLSVIYELEQENNNDF